MASSTLTTTLHDDVSTKTYDLAGTSLNESVWRDDTYSLTEPRTIKQTINLGQPGAKGNDKITIKCARTVENGASTGFVTGTVTIIVSLPRDSGFTEASARDLIAEAASLLPSANRILIADGMPL